MGQRGILAGMRSLTARISAGAAPFVLAASLFTGCSSALSAPTTGSTSIPTSEFAASEVPASSGASSAALKAAFAGLEKQYAARLGLWTLDTGTGRSVTYRADERFAHASTFKALAAGVLLKRVSEAQLDQVIHYSAADLEDYSPITGRHVGTGMSLRDLIAAGLQYSDNTAANLMLAKLGGPAGLERALRALGDETTNIDRTEPTVNTAIPGDPRDTSTAHALGTDLQGFVLGRTLSPKRRQLLKDWLIGNTTGDRYIRAGVPTGWTIGDKTGAAAYGTRNDIAIAWPTTGAPIVIAVLSDRGVADAASDDALIADATRTAIAALR
jgi:beta-lactamase class A